MKLIQVEYLSATDTEGTRFSASAGWDGPTERVIVGYDYAIDFDDNVIAAARQLVAKIWETKTRRIRRDLNPPEVVPDVGNTRAGFDVVRLKFKEEAE